MANEVNIMNTAADTTDTAEVDTGDIDTGDTGDIDTGDIGEVDSDTGDIIGEVDSDTDTIDPTESSSSSSSVMERETLTIDKYNSIKDDSSNNEEEKKEDKKEDKKKILLEFIESLDKYNIAKNKLTKVYQKYISLFEPFRKNIFNMDLLLEELDDPGFEFHTKIKPIVTYFDNINKQKKKDAESYNFGFMKELELSFKIFLSLKNNIPLINQLVLYVTLKENDDRNLKYIFESLIDQYIHFIHNNTIEFCNEEKMVNKEIYLTVVLLLFKLFKKILRIDVVHDFLICNFKDFNDCTNNIFQLLSVTEHIKKYLYKL